MTTCVFGGASLFTKAPCLTEVHMLHVLLAQRFFKLSSTPNNVEKTSLDQLPDVENHLNEKQKFGDWLGFPFYERELVRDEVVWHLRRNPPAKLTNILTIGVFEGHAFLIKDIKKLGKMFICNHCNGKFTKSCNLERHSETCSKGETVLVCPGEKVEAPESAFQKAFYPRLLFFGINPVVGRRSKKTKHTHSSRSVRTWRRALD